MRPSARVLLPEPGLAAQQSEPLRIIGQSRLWFCRSTAVRGGWRCLLRSPSVNTADGGNVAQASRPPARHGPRPMTEIDHRGLLGVGRHVGRLMPRILGAAESLARVTDRGITLFTSHDARSSVSYLYISHSTVPHAQSCAGWPLTVSAAMAAAYFFSSIIGVPHVIGAVFPADFRRNSCL